MMESNLEKVDDEDLDMFADTQGEVIERKHTLKKKKTQGQSTELLKMLGHDPSKMNDQELGMMTDFIMKELMAFEKKETRKIEKKTKNKKGIEV